MDRVVRRTIRGRGGDADEVIASDYDVRGNLVSEVRTAGGLSTRQQGS